MASEVFKVIEIVGCSERSIEDAIQGAITRAGQTLTDLAWFQVTETRGNISDGKIVQYQVVLKIGFHLRS